MRLTALQLNRATLGRQLLLARQKVGVVEVVRAVCAIQAQSPPSPYVALWNRVAGFDPADLDRAFAEHRVVKASLMRMTLHAVTADDYPAFQRAMGSAVRRSRLGDKRFVAANLSSADIDRLIEEMLVFATEARTNPEFEAFVRGRVGVLPEPGVWWALRAFAPVLHAPVGQPWSFGDRPSFIASRFAPFDGDVSAALALLVRRYLEAFGPASAADAAQFTSIAVTSIRGALETLGEDLVTYAGPDGALLHDVRGGAVPPEETSAPPRLMAMWDSILLAYRDRSRIVPDAYRKVVTRTNGDTLPTILVDGLVAGIWRPAPGRPDAIEATAFHRLDEPTWRGLEVEARSLVAFLADRQPDVYRRYGRWWADMPSAEVRLLAG